MLFQIIGFRQTIYFKRATDPIQTPCLDIAPRDGRGQASPNHPGSRSVRQERHLIYGAVGTCISGSHTFPKTGPARTKIWCKSPESSSDATGMPLFLPAQVCLRAHSPATTLA